MLFSNLVMWLISNIAEKINGTITLSLAKLIQIIRTD
jgi:hypothetical protein